MLADPAFCDLVHAIGVASLGADDKQIWHLTKIYCERVEEGWGRPGARWLGGPEIPTRMTCALWLMLGYVHPAMHARAHPDSPGHYPSYTNPNPTPDKHPPKPYPLSAFAPHTPSPPQPPFPAPGYTVEFGVVREGGQAKAFGAGILSSYGELQHMAAGRARLVPFDPFAAQPKMSYKDGCAGAGVGWLSCCCCCCIVQVFGGARAAPGVLLLAVIRRRQGEQWCACSTQ